MGIKETGDRVHMRRRALGLTQQQLAELCGFPYQIISRVEKGHQDLYAQRLALIAKHLRVSADYLLGLTDKEEKLETPDSQWQGAALELVEA